MTFRPHAFARLAIIAQALIVAACSNTTQITVMHNPLYRAEAHTSTITATASNPDRKIAEIKIDVIDGDMTACVENGGLPSVVPCRANPTFQARICQFPSHPATATCTWNRPLGDRRLISYDATARTASGVNTETRTVTYAAGASITSVSVGSADGVPVVMAWDVARPVYWHATFPSGLTARSRIHVGFFPDADYASYRAFTDELQPLVLGAFFNSNAGFSQFYSFWRGNFDLWAGPPGADAQTDPTGGTNCVRNFNNFASNAAAITDGDVIMHTANFRDCASISLGGSGTVWTGITNPAFRFMHESGHFLQGLGDEYCCNGGYFSNATPRNIDTSKGNCEATATSIGVDKALCVEIGTSGRWRITDGSGDIMEDRSIVADDWRDAAGRAVGNRMNACNSGNCF